MAATPPMEFSAKLAQTLNLDGTPRSLAFSPDSQRLAVGLGLGDDARNSTICVFATNTWSKERDVSFDDVQPCVRFSPDNALIAACGFGGKVHVWRASDGGNVCKFSRGPISRALDFSPDSNRIAVSGTNDATIINAETGERMQSWHVASGLINGLAYSPQAEVVATCGHLHAVALWNPQNGKQLFSNSAGQGIFLAFAPNGRFVATVYCPQTDLGGGRSIKSSNSILQMVDTSSHAVLYDRELPNEPLGAISFTADGWHLAIGTRNASVRLLNARTGEAVAQLPVNTQAVTAIGLSPDGQYMVTGSEHESRLEVWKLETQKFAK
jgi:WD40 repeat protein